MRLICQTCAVKLLLRCNPHGHLAGTNGGLLRLRNRLVLCWETAPAHGTVSPLLGHSMQNISSCLQLLQCKISRLLAQRALRSGGGCNSSATHGAGTEHSVTLRGLRGRHTGALLLSRNDVSRVSGTAKPQHFTGKQKIGALR